MSADRPRTPESTDGLAASLHVEPDAVDRWPDRFYEEAVDHVAGLRLSLPIVCAEILGADPREVSGWPPHRLAAALRDHCVAAPSAPPANEKATEPAALPEAAEVQPPTKDIAHV